MTLVGNSAFYGCTKLADVTFASGALQKIDSFAFEYCSSLTRLVIPEPVASIGTDSFNACYSLEYVSLPSTLTTINDGAFEFCTALTYISFPESLTEIGDYVPAFSVVFKDESGKTVVSDAGNLKGKVFTGSDAVLYHTKTGTTGDCTWAYVPATNVLTISGDGAMADYSDVDAAPWGVEVNEVVIADGVTAVGAYALSGCSSLSSIEIPASVTSVGDKAFMNCTGILYASFPSTLSAVGADAFDGLTFEYVDGTEMEVVVSDLAGNVFTGSDAVLSMISGTTGDCTWSYDQFSKTIIVSGDGAMADYESGDTHWKAVVECVVLEDGVTSVGAYAFEGCTLITSITFPSSLSVIGEHAFDGCTSITSITEIPGIIGIFRQA